MITIDHLVCRIAVRILSTRPHLWSANFGPRFTRYPSARLHFTRRSRCTVQRNVNFACVNYYIFANCSQTPA